jgi:hypothetical protein
VSEHAGRLAVLALDKNPRFPKKDPLFSNKRYWPAVRAFMAARHGISMAAPQPVDGEEVRNGPPALNGRARHRVASSR